MRRDLRGLSKEGAEFVGAHLFMAGMLAEEDPASAWRHARAARSKGGRIAVVRETVGLVAYRAGEWAEAIAELRAARRMSGGPGQLPVMADCERALGHPEKAIEMSRSAEAAELDPSSAAELRIVVAGARADLGQLDAALAHLEAAVRSEVVEPYSARLFYAYADLLLQADRRAEAVDFFMKAAEADADEETDAGDRLTELAGGEVGATDAEIVELDGEFTDGDDVAGRYSDETDPLTEEVTDTLEVTLEDERDDVDEGSAGGVDQGSDYSLNDMDLDDDQAHAIVNAPAEVDAPADVDAPAEVEVGTEESSADESSADESSADESSAEESGATQLDDVLSEPTPARPATPPSSMSSLFSHNEGGL
ncbi:tetratricopeptide (TPR) repeat protein [Nakamurella sp. UYEF19]|uniref:tetratricopeptide repeat protein n=1 Tax=Nakamurella sp. UYEF19 TaxID=1756392 RepID=UPI003395D70D